MMEQQHRFFLNEDQYWERTVRYRACEKARTQNLYFTRIVAVRDSMSSRTHLLVHGAMLQGLLRVWCRLTHKMKDVVRTSQRTSQKEMPKNHWQSAGISHVKNRFWRHTGIKHLRTHFARQTEEIEIITFCISFQKCPVFCFCFLKCTR